MVIEFFGKLISKCPNLKKKMKHVPAYMLLFSLSNKVKLFDSHSESPCISTLFFIQFLSSLCFFNSLLSMHMKSQTLQLLCFLVLCVFKHLSDFAVKSQKLQLIPIKGYLNVCQRGFSSFSKNQKLCQEIQITSYQLDLVTHQLLA